METVDGCWCQRGQCQPGEARWEEPTTASSCISSTCSGGQGAVGSVRPSKGRGPSGPAPWSQLGALRGTPEQGMLGISVTLLAGLVPVTLHFSSTPTAPHPQKRAVPVRGHALSGSRTHNPKPLDLVGHGPRPTYRPIRLPGVWLFHFCLLVRLWAFWLDIQVRSFFFLTLCNLPTPQKSRRAGASGCTVHTRVGLFAPMAVPSAAKPWLCGFSSPSRSPNEGLAATALSPTLFLPEVTLKGRPLKCKGLGCSGWCTQGGANYEVGNLFRWPGLRLRGLKYSFPKSGTAGPRCQQHKRQEARGPAVPAPPSSWSVGQGPLLLGALVG
ncbi:uncharacterized protein LOC114008260 [Tupaia chinensis]|uniref:uncharacterized protein LOC114008260 n=1 Tax=Tupaia chinensis TaxID=246437 RepID=UPI000FFC1834|nr:uncharacterized protein LOC114008260 [Tupaia chinensis]